MKKYICSFIALFCSALPLFAQLEKGTVLFSPGFSDQRQKVPQFEPRGTAVVASSDAKYTGVGFQVGVMGKKHREWGLGASYEWEKTFYQTYPNPNPIYVNEIKKLAGSVYHRKYYPLHERLWAGYQIQFMVAAYNGSSMFLDTPQPDAFLGKGPLRVLLEGNAFIGGFITPRIGARLSAGSARLGYFFIRDGLLSGGGGDQTDRFEAGLGWRPAGAAQFSLVWAINKPETKQ